MTQPAAEAPATRPLTIPRLQSAEFEITHLVATVESGVTIDDVLRPEFWAICGRQLKIGTEITVRTDDESFYAKLLVRQAGSTYAKVHLLHYVDLNPKDVTEEIVKPQFVPEWAGGNIKYRVRRTSDNVVVSQGHPDKATAQNWIAEHLKALS